MVEIHSATECWNLKALIARKQCAEFKSRQTKSTIERDKFHRFHQPDLTAQLEGHHPQAAPWIRGLIRLAPLRHRDLV